MRSTLLGLFLVAALAATPAVHSEPDAPPAPLADAGKDLAGAEVWFRVEREGKPPVVQRLSATAGADGIARITVESFAIGAATADPGATVVEVDARLNLRRLARPGASPAPALPAEAIPEEILWLVVPRLPWAHGTTWSLPVLTGAGRSESWRGAWLGTSSFPHYGDYVTADMISLTTPEGGRVLVYSHARTIVKVEAPGCAMFAGTREQVDGGPATGNEKEEPLPQPAAMGFLMALLTGDLEAVERALDYDGLQRHLTAVSTRAANLSREDLRALVEREVAGWRTEGHAAMEQIEGWMRTVKVETRDGLAVVTLPDFSAPIRMARVGTEWRVVFLSTFAIAVLEGESPEALTALLAEAGERGKLAGRALAKQGRRAVPALIGALAHGTASVRVEAAQALGSLGADAAEAVPALLDAMKKKDEAKWAFVLALGRIGPAAQAAVPLLVETLADPDEATRANSAAALGAVGGTPDRVEGPLARALSDASPHVRRFAAQSLCKIEGLTPAVVAPLAKACQDSSADVRGLAALALGRMGEPAAPAAGSLGELLRDAEWRNRAQAAQSLGAMGAGAKAQVPNLMAVMKDAHPTVRKEAVLSLGRIGSETRSAHPALLEALRDSVGDVRVSAAAAMVHLQAVDLVPGLLGELKDAPAPTRDLAAAVLGKIAPAEEAVIAALTAACADADRKVQASARSALAEVQARKK